LQEERNKLPNTDHRKLSELSELTIGKLSELTIGRGWCVFIDFEMHL